VTWLACDKEQPEPPVGNTNKIMFEVYSVTPYPWKAEINYKIENLNQNRVQSFVICYNTTGVPTLDDKTVSLEKNSSGSIVIDGLSPDTEYYYRLYAEISGTKIYSDDKNFSTSSIFDGEMVSVDGGSFKMGCTNEQSYCNDDETPAHTVTVDGFKISKYEITTLQYADFMNELGVSANGSYLGKEYLDMDYYMCQIKYSDGKFVPENGTENRPVIEVTWYGAKAFCEHYGGRLPTEAEWEFAARGGNSANATLYAGSDDIDDVAWYLSNCSRLQGVGWKLPNELGIYDMSGNAWEWCNDWYRSDFYSNSPRENPQGPSTGYGRVLRGGGYSDYDKSLYRVANRHSKDPSSSNTDSGFRFCQDL
jgi:formylglycine-generating enzyme required for sulfatase activity